MVDVVQELTIRGHICCIVYAKLTDKPVKAGVAAEVVKYNIPGLIEYETNTDKKDVDFLSSILEQELPDVVFFCDFIVIIWAQNRWNYQVRSM